MASTTTRMSSLKNSPAGDMQVEAVVDDSEISLYKDVMFGTLWDSS